MELLLIISFYMLLPVIVGPTEEPVLPGKFSSITISCLSCFLVPHLLEQFLSVWCVLCSFNFKFFEHQAMRISFKCFFFIVFPLSPSSDEDDGFSPWSLWSPCTKTCTDALSPAIKSRHRKCIKVPCSGSSHQEKACNLPQCQGTTRTYINSNIISLFVCQPL